MEKWKKIVDKVSTYATIALFASIFLEIFFPMFGIVTVISSSLIYITILLKNRIARGKLDKVLTILCTMSLSWVLLREFTESPYVGILGMIIVYAFMSWSYYSAMGNINKFVAVTGSIAVLCATLNIYIDSNIFGYAILGLQVFIILKFIDPILEKLGQEHRAKRLAAEAKNLAAEVNKS